MVRALAGDSTMTRSLRPRASAASRTLVSWRSPAAFQALAALRTFVGCRASTALRASTADDIQGSTP